MSSSLSSKKPFACSPLLPGAGAAYPQGGIPGVRRLYVPKVACHLYYTFDEREVIVRALWGARRDRGPRFGS
jgi:hypothetical protein